MNTIFRCFAICVLLLASKGFAGPGGEFIAPGTGYSISAVLSGTGYGWDGRKVTYISSWSTSGQTAWDCPQSQKNGKPYMPWGNIQFTITKGSQQFVFNLDFRDEDWAKNQTKYPASDTYLDISSDFKFQLRTSSNLITTLTYGYSYSIYAVWGVAANTDAFGTPVFLQDQYSGSEAGGSLTVGTDIVPSGQYGVTHNVSQTTIATNQERFIVQNDQRKHLEWNSSSSDFLLSRSVPVPQTLFPEVAVFRSLSPVVVGSTMDGISAGQVQFLDPWYVNQNGQQTGQDWNTFTPSGTPPGAYGQSTGGVFLLQPIDPAKPYYSVRALLTQQILQSDSYFQNWITNSGANVGQSSGSTTGYDQKGVVFSLANATVTASYKGHLRTGAPSLTDAKNQRRAVSAPYGSSTNWYAVYESMGDIWITNSDDSGKTWIPEARLNVNRGNAFNPTISNAFTIDGTDVPKVIIGWLELNHGSYEMHLQTMCMILGHNHCYFGWKTNLDTSNSGNHRRLSDIDVGLPLPIAGARLSLQLDPNGSNGALLTYAHETAGGILSGQLNFPNTGGHTLSDLDGVVELSATSASLHTGDLYPVIISYPGAFGYSSRLCIYYLGGGYASGYRVVEYDYSSHNRTVLAPGSGDYTYTSLQGAPNPSGASFALVASGLNNSSNPFVNYYIKETYLGSSPAHLSYAYPATQQPTIMVENSAVFGSATTEIDMLQPGQTPTWYKGGSISWTTLGTSIAGVFTRAIVPLLDRSSIVARNTVNPARFDRYSGSGQLSKTGDLPVDVRAFRYWTQGGSPERLLVLDFSGTCVIPMDSLETGQIVCAMQVLIPGSNGSLVQQLDSLAVPLQVDLVRGGQTIRSFAATSWKSLSSQSIAQFSPGDILMFSMLAPARKTRGYLEVSFRGNSAQKAIAASQTTEILSPSQNSFDAYPNPFNPSTHLVYQLSEPGTVKLIIYDILGREVQELVNGVVDAGLHDVVWDAAKVASGIYYAHLTVTDDLNRLKTSKVSRLLFMK